MEDKINKIKAKLWDIIAKQVALNTDLEFLEKAKVPLMHKLRELEKEIEKGEEKK